MDRKIKNKNIFLEGIRDGLPIALGYFAVSFSLGIQAKNAGFTPFEGFLASLLTNASAGEYAGILVILGDSGFVMMMLMTIVASARYFLMGCALSQRFDPKMPFVHRLLIAFDLTDEIFGAQISRPGYIQPRYTYGVFVLPLIGWSTGTMFGIIMGNLLPSAVVSALSVALYGMFIAIIVPPAKKDRIVLFGVLASFALSFACSRLPWVSKLSEGTRTLILTVLIAGAMALFFPVSENRLNGAEEESDEKTVGPKAESDEKDAGPKAKSDEKNAGPKAESDKEEEVRK